MMRLTKIRTGNGDSGTTQVGSLRVSKASPEVAYLGALDMAGVASGGIQNFLDGTPDLLADAFFTLGANFHNPANEQVQIHLNYLLTNIEERLNRLLEKRPVELTGFLLTNPYNYSIMMARCAIRDAETKAVYLYEQLRMDYMKSHIVLLNIISDLLFISSYQQTKQHRVWVAPGKIVWENNS